MLHSTDIQLRFFLQFTVIDGHSKYGLTKRKAKRAFNLATSRLLLCVPALKQVFGAVCRKGSLKTLHNPVT